MEFFLYQIVARIVAVYLGVDCWRRISDALAERKIAVFNSDLLDWYRYPDLHRDAAPILYWTTVSFQIIALAACAVVAVHGWWHPDT